MNWLDLKRFLSCSYHCSARITIKLFDLYIRNTTDPLSTEKNTYQIPCMEISGTNGKDTDDTKIMS